jgi:DNA-binding XRE family transcriptional regulator
MDVLAIRHRKMRGETTAILAECFEVTKRTIRYHCKDLPSVGKRINVGEVISLRQEGYTFPQIAQRIDADRTAIHRALRRHMMEAA